MTSADPASGRPAVGLGRAVVVPLAVVALASALWLISDRLLYIGPLDRATFAWVVVIPIWAAAPLVAGFAWRGLSARARTLAAATCALVIGAIVGALLWQDVAFPACPTGPARGPLEWLLPATVVGVVIGGGFGVNCLIASAQLRAGQPKRALTYGAFGQVAVVASAAVLSFVLFIGVCQRP